MYRKRFAESMLTSQQLRTFTEVRESLVGRELKSGKDGADREGHDIQSVY